MTSRRTTRSGALTAIGLVLAAAAAFAHSERPIDSPPRPGSVPDANRRSAHTLVVCKPSSKPTRAEHADIHLRLRTTTGDALALARAQEAAWHRNTRLFKKCRFEHIQDAVDVAPNDTAIEVMPGVYREEPSRAAPTTSCGDLNCAYSYEYHVAHPHDANLVAILGKTNITLEGTGADPHDVLVDVGFAKDVGVRCDRCTGFIVRNLWERDANEHGIYVVESDGYIFDRTIGSFNDDYSLFSFASDHGLYTDCDASGSGDAGLYVGGAPKTPGRVSTTVQRCKLHHNALGFSGTQGNYVEMVDNDVFDNAIGISFDTEQDHPNAPLDHCMIVNNDIHDNNFDIYAPDSDRPPGGPAYDLLHYPVGTGAWVISGQSCTVTGNRIWNNHCFGTMLFANPLEMATSDGNQQTDNIMGAAAGGANGTMCGTQGVDFWWDESGTNNCWQDNGAVTSDPATLPDCSLPNAGAANPLKDAILASCLIADPSTGQTLGNCPFGTSNQAPYLSRDQAECGNGIVDLGEDCDPGYPAGSLPETCETLGHGPGALGCPTVYDSASSAFLCLWDTSQCAAPACARYGKARLRLGNMGAPNGDETLRFSGRKFDGSGRTFNPVTEDVSVVLRDDSQLFYLGRISAGSPHWSASAGRYLYLDPAGSNDGIVSIDLRAVPGFGGPFKAAIEVGTANLGAAATTRDAFLTLRVGDDCWSAGMACMTSLSGQAVTCRKGSMP